MIDSITSEKYNKGIGRDESILAELENLSHDLKENGDNLKTKLDSLELLSKRLESLRQKETTICKKFDNMRTQLDHLLGSFEQSKDLRNRSSDSDILEHLQEDKHIDPYYKQQSIDDTYNSLTSGRFDNKPEMPYSVIDQELHKLTNLKKLHPGYSEEFIDILHSLDELCQVIPPTTVNIENINELTMSVKNTIETFTILNLQ